MVKSHAFPPSGVYQADKRCTGSLVEKERRSPATPSTGCPNGSVFALEVYDRVISCLTSSHEPVARIEEDRTSSDAKLTKPLLPASPVVQRTDLISVQPGAAVLAIAPTPFGRHWPSLTAKRSRQAMASPLPCPLSTPATFNSAPDLTDPEVITVTRRAMQMTVSQAEFARPEKVQCMLVGPYEDFAPAEGRSSIIKQSS